MLTIFVVKIDVVEAFNSKATMTASQCSVPFSWVKEKSPWTGLDFLSNPSVGTILNWKDQTLVSSCVEILRVLYKDGSIEWRMLRLVMTNTESRRSLW